MADEVKTDAVDDITLVTTNTDNNEQSDDSEQNSKKASRVFTQEELNRIAAREKSQGKESAYKELGIDPSDTKTVNMFKAFLSSQKTDDDKKIDDVLQAKQKEDEANRRVLVAEAKAEAMVQGAKKQYVDDIVTLAMSKMTDENADLNTIVNEFKTKYTIWFDQADEDEKKNVGKKGTGTSVKTDSTSNSKGETKGLGARLAAQRKAQVPKSNFWGKK